MQLPRQYRTFFSIDSDPTPTATRGLRVGNTGEAFRADALAALGLIRAYADTEAEGGHLCVARKSTAAVISSDCRSHRIKLQPMPCRKESQACDSYYRAIRSIAKAHGQLLVGRPTKMNYAGLQDWLTTMDIRRSKRPGLLIPGALAMALALIALLLTFPRLLGDIDPIYEKDRNTLYVLDTSESMGADWGDFGMQFIDAAQRMLIANLRAMPEDDTTNIVVFDDVAKPLDAQRTTIETLDQDERQALIEKIKKIELGRHSNLEDGLSKAFDQLANVPQTTKVTIELYTDGLPTRGQANLAQLRDFVRRRNQAPKAKINVYGFGKLREEQPEYAKFLEQLASDTSGSFTQLDDPRQIGVKVTPVDWLRHQFDRVRSLFIGGPGTHSQSSAAVSQTPFDGDRPPFDPGLASVDERRPAANSQSNRGSRIGTAASPGGEPYSARPLGRLHQTPAATYPYAGVPIPSMTAFPNNGRGMALTYVVGAERE